MSASVVNRYVEEIVPPGSRAGICGDAAAFKTAAALPGSGSVTHRRRQLRGAVALWRIKSHASRSKPAKKTLSAAAAGVGQRGTQLAPVVVSIRRKREEGEMIISGVASAVITA
jgi:hypothetical protein